MGYICPPNVIVLARLRAPLARLTRRINLK
jgi:hypothetical protein